MKIDYKIAKDTCTATEFSLLQDSMPKSLTGFTTPELKRKAAQVRKYNDKWADLSRAQGSSKDGAAARSKMKHEWFQEALKRIESRISRVAAAAAKEAKKAHKTPRKAAPNGIPRPPAKGAVKASTKMASKRGGMLPSARQAEQKRISSELRIAASGVTSRIHGHVSAQGRRNQAARSSRKRSS